MLSQIPKKLIIVGNKDTDVYCEYLSMLVSTVDDIVNEDTTEGIILGIKDGSVDTAIWTDEIYRDNRAHTSSRQKMLFIGDEGCAKNIIKNIQFDENDKQKFGIYHGWLGNKASIYVDETLSKNFLVYKNEFLPQYEELNKRYNTRIGKKAEMKEKNKNIIRNVGLGAAGFLLVGALPVMAIAGGNAIKDAKTAIENKKIIMDQAYRYAVLKFYLDYLERFME